MADANKYYLTTPIYYVNARPHIGHAYTTIVADVLARRHRLLGEETWFLTGTDEHGQKIERSAAAAGIAPQQFADGVSAEFRKLWDRMGITYNDYIRTTEPRHAKGVQKLFAALYEKGYIYLDSYTGAYCVSDEAFVDVPVGTPCPDCGRITEQVTEENFFFKLSAFQEKLIELIESNTLKIENDARRNEVLSFLRGSHPRVNELAIAAAESLPRVSGESPKQFLGRVQQAVLEHPDMKVLKEKGEISHTSSKELYVPGALKDLSVSRSSFTWGIQVPEEVERKAGATQKHVVYVWLDALANYMTAIGYGSDEPDDVEKLAKFWPADLHLVGKEIIRFHCVYWPAFLMAAELPLPKAITAHGWLLFDNAKMSKSKGNIVRTETILEAFGEHVYAKQFPDSTKEERDLFASDVLRYFLLREIPFGQDGSFSFDSLVTRYNADLANGYGNLVSRTLAMISKYCANSIPAPEIIELADLYGRSLLTGDLIYSLGIRNRLADLGAVTAGDDIQNDFNKVMSVPPIAELVGSLLEMGELNIALEKIALFVSHVDTYLSSSAPWTLAKSNERTDQLLAVLYVAVECIRIITALIYPVAPSSAAKVWLQLGLGDIEVSAKNGELKNLQWGGLKPGTKLGTLAPIFPRADKSLVETMIDMENENAKPNEPRPESPLKQAFTPTPAQPVSNDPTHPAAPPRAFTEPGSATQVAGSSSITTHNGPTPSHTEAVPSAPFSSPAAQAPITAGPADGSPQITIDDFVKVELRIAQVLVAERIPKADKLLRLEVDLGYEKRQILSGIAEHYAPEDLIGRRIIVITNLAPRKMRGLESHGMLLAASEEGGKPFLATVPEGVPVGTRLK